MKNKITSLAGNKMLCTLLAQNVQLPSSKHEPMLLLSVGVTVEVLQTLGRTCGRPQWLPYMQVH